MRTRERPRSTLMTTAPGRGLEVAERPDPPQRRTRIMLLRSKNIEAGRECDGDGRKDGQPRTFPEWCSPGPCSSQVVRPRSLEHLERLDELELPRPAKREACRRSETLRPAPGDAPFLSSSAWLRSQ